MAWCLTKTGVEEFTKALREGKINPEKLAGMTSEQRRKFFTELTGEENATNINSLFESKLLLKNQRQGMVTWAKRILGMQSQYKRDLLSKIEGLDEIGVLDPKDLQSFKEDLVKTRLGLNITFEEAKTINQLSQERVEAKSDWEAELNENPEWSEDSFSTRKKWINNPKRIEYGLKQVALENYVNDLKLTARKIRFRESPIKATLDAVGKIPGAMKSFMSSIDNSFWGRQGIKNLYGSFSQKRIWTRNFLKSFKDIGRELRAKKIDGFEPMDLIKSDIYSRPNALNGKYKAGRYKLDVLHEEVFPSSVPEKIPVFGRLFKASETAFNGGALRMRADLADLLISKADKQGINTLNPDQARGMGHLVGSLTGRGSLGKGEVFGRELNVLLFSARFFKSNFDTITAHQFDPQATKFTKIEAGKNLVSIVAHVTGILLLAGFLDDESVELDPRSTNFGRVKVFGQWTDITGGMRIIAIMAARLVPTRRNGKWGIWRKSTTGKWTDLTEGRFGMDDAVDVFMDALILNRLSPIAAIIRDAYRGEMFGGEPFDIKKSIINSITPLSIQQVSDVKDKSFETILGVSIAEFVGLGVSTYKYKTNWERSTSQEMKNFKSQVGEDKFKRANEDYNRVYSIWLEEVQKDSKYKNLSDDGKEKLKSDARKAIKEKILKEYGYKEKKKKKTEEEKKEEKVREKLKP